MQKSRILFLAFIFFVVTNGSATFAVVVTYPESKTYTEMDNYQVFDVWQCDSVSNPHLEFPPGYGPATLAAGYPAFLENGIETRIESECDQCGGQVFTVGINITKENGSRDFEKIKGTPVRITINFSFTYAGDEGVASWGYSGPDDDIFRDLLETQYAVSSVPTTLSRSFTAYTTYGELGPLAIVANPQTYTLSYEDPENPGTWICPNPGHTFFTYMKVEVQSVEIRFGATPKEDPNSVSGDPVNVVTGNMFITEADLHVSGPGLPFVFNRRYDSQSSKTAGMGWGWAHNYDIELLPPDDDTQPAVILDMHGHPKIFTQTTPGVFEPPTGEYSSLVYSGGLYKWKKKGGVTYTFGSTGRLESINDKNDNYINLTYNQEGMLETLYDTANRAYQLAYNLDGRLITVTDPIGREVSYQYDTQGNLTQATNAAGETTVYTYLDANDAHNITKRSVNGQFEFNYQFDAQDRCISAGGPSGELGNTFDYYPEENYTIITDAKGGPTVKHFNDDGMITRIVYPDVSEELYTFDAAYNKTSATGRDGETWQFAYDARGNVTQITDPDGDAENMTYDTEDRLLTLTDKAGRQTTNTYDGIGNLTRVTYADTSQINYTYTALGQVETITDQAGDQTHFSYDAQGNLTGTTDAENNFVGLAYDAVGRLTGKTDPAGHQTTYSYDERDRITKTVDALAGEVDTEHDSAGMTRLEDQNDNATLFAYNALDQLTSVTDPLGREKTFAYDDNGNLVSVSDPNGNVKTSQYDALNRLVAVQYPDTSGIAYTYDAAGRVTQMVDASGTSTYTYDKLGRLTGYTSGAGHTLGYAYDTAGNLAALTYPGSKTVTYAYDSMNRMVSVTDWAGRQTTYQYDARGNPGTITLPTGVVVQFGYDATGALLSMQSKLADSSVVAGYARVLDANGNVASESAEQPLDPLMAPETVAYAYGVENRLTSAGPTSVTHDNNGNCTAKGDASYAYDYENRLLSVATTSGSAAFSYDGAGALVGSTIDGVTTAYLLDKRGMTHILMEFDDQGAVSAYYVYGLGLLYKVDALDQVYVYHYNPIGSTVAMTDGSGSIVNKYAYSPFGMLTGSVEGVSNRFRFVGKYGVMDVGENLHYMRNRFYDADTGRFLSKDPIGLRGGINQYLYALDNPKKLLDPIGLCPKGNNISTLGDLDVSNNLGESGNILLSEASILSTINNDNDVLWQAILDSFSLKSNRPNAFSVGSGIVEAYILKDPMAAIPSPPNPWVNLIPNVLERGYKKYYGKSWKYYNRYIGQIFGGR